MIPPPRAFLFSSPLFRSISVKLRDLIQHPLPAPLNLFAYAAIRCVHDYSLLWIHFPAGSVVDIAFSIAQIALPYRRVGFGYVLGMPDDGNADGVPFLIHG